MCLVPNTFFLILPVIVLELVTLQLLSNFQGLLAYVISTLLSYSDKELKLTFFYSVFNTFEGV